MRAPLPILPLLLVGCLNPNAGGNLVPGTVDEDSSLPSMDLNDSRFRVETRGDASDPCVVFLHGGPGNDYAVFERNAVIADHGFHVVLWDQRGSGLSRRHAARDYTGLEQLVDDLDALIETTCSPAEAVHLVGYSWGGMYATLYLSRRPNIIATAVLIEPGPIDTERSQDVLPELSTIDIFGPTLSRYELSAEVLSPEGHARLDFHSTAGVLEGAIPGYHFDPDDPMPLVRFGTVAGSAIQGLAVVNGVPDYDLADGIERHKGPIVLVRGSLNEILDLEHHQITAARLNNAEIVTFDDVGHDLPWTAAGALNELLITRLSS